METTETRTKRQNVYDIVTGRMIEQLEKGIIPWQRKVTALPRNFITQKPYRGVNVLLLTASEFKQPYFLPFNQIKELGATVKDGEKPFPVVYWKKPEDENGKPVLRYFNVYNVEQCEGIPEDKFPVAVSKDKIELCKDIVGNMPALPEIMHDTESCFYNAKSDYIAMHHFFKNSEEYYSELFEHLVECTGHSKRLARKEFADFFGKTHTEEFHTEKLIVQIGAFILRTHCGIADGNSDKTVHSVFAYLDKLRHDRKLIVYAAFRAQQAVNYILNRQKEDVL